MAQLLFPWFIVHLIRHCKLKAFFIACTIQRACSHQSLNAKQFTVKKTSFFKKPMIIRAKRRTCFYLQGNKVKGENEGHCTVSFCDYLLYKELKIKGEKIVPFTLFFEIRFSAHKLLFLQSE